MRRNILLVVGAKVPAAGPRPTRFHVAERTYGRFARTVRVDAAVDATRAKATMRRGQLRIVLPRLTDRRGVAISIPVEAAG
jgi:HSP20 family protein